MDRWRTVWELARGLFAAIGMAVCAVVLSLIGLGLAFSSHDAPEASRAADPRLGAEPSVLPPAPQEEAELDGAASLLNEAGVLRHAQPLTIIGHRPAAWLPDEHSHVELWCLRAPGMEVHDRWMPVTDLEPQFAPAVASTIQALHGAHPCVPAWQDVVTRRMAMQPMQLIYSQRRLSFARIALYDRESETLYLLSRALSLPPPSPSPPTPNVVTSAPLE